MRDHVVLQVVAVVQELDASKRRLLPNCCSLPPMLPDLRVAPVSRQGPMHQADKEVQQVTNTWQRLAPPSCLARELSGSSRTATKSPLRFCSMAAVDPVASKMPCHRVRTGHRYQNMSPDHCITETTLSLGYWNGMFSVIICVVLCFANHLIQTKAFRISHSKTCTCAFPLPMAERPVRCPAWPPPPPPVQWPRAKRHQNLEHLRL